MATKIVNVNQIKAGSYLLVDGVACRVSDAQSSKSGKHGHAKIRIVAIGLMDNKKRELVLPSGHSVEVPIIEKNTAQVLSISGNTANVMDNESYETFDIEIPEEFKDKIIEGANILYWDIMGRRVLKQVKGAD